MSTYEFFAVVPEVFLYGHRAVLPRFKISKWDCKSTKICDATTLFSNKTEIVKWDMKYQDCHWATRDWRDSHFFKLFMTSLHFDSDGFQLVRKQHCRNSHEICYMKLCYMQGNWCNNWFMITHTVVVYIALRGEGRHALQIY